MPAKRRPAAPPPVVQPARAAIYLRVSTDEQVQGYGLDVQLERSRAQIVAKGWQHVATFSDEGISGTKGADERPQLAAMLAAARSGEFDAVVVLALDRLGRKTALVLQLVEQLATAGAQLVSCKESLDTSTPQGQFVLTMFAALAELERGVIVERTTAGREDRGRKDGDRGGRMPLGYLRPPAKHIPPLVDEEGAKIVRRIFALRRHGLTIRAIAERLNDDAVPPPRGAARWIHTSVYAVLQNETAYKGGQRGNSPVRWPKLL